MLQGYRSAFWFASCVSFAGLLLVLSVVRVRGGHGDEGGTVGERALKKATPLDEA